MFQTRAILASLALLTSLSLAAKAETFDPWTSYLPENRVVEITGDFGSGELESILRTGLNSIGDTLALRLEGEMQVVFGGRVAFGATAERTEQGAYRLSILREVAVTAGADVDAVEVDGAIGGTFVVEYEFATVAECARGLEALAICTALGPGADLALALQEANLLDARRVLNDARSALERELNRLVGPQSELSRLRDRLRDVLDEITEEEGVIDDVCGFLGIARLCDGARAALNRLRSTRDSLNRQIRAQENIVRGIEGAIAAARRVVDTARVAVTAAERAVQEVLDVIDRIADQRRFLLEHTSGFQVDLFVDLGASAGLNPTPGVTIENGDGLRAAAELETRASLRQRRDLRSGAEELVVKYVSDLGGSLASRFVVGAQVEASVAVEQTFTWERRGSRTWRPSTTKVPVLAVATDFTLVDSIGYGVAAQLGLGRFIAVTFTHEAIGDGITAFFRALIAGDLERMVAAVDSVPAEFEVEDRWIAGFAAGGGVQAAASASLNALARWSDLGEAGVETLTLGDGLRRLLTPLVISRSFLWMEATLAGAEGELGEEIEGGSARPSFVRGDTNDDGLVDLTDAFGILGYLYTNAREPGCLEAADADDDGSVQVTDSVYLLNFLYLNGATLPAPGATLCGADPVDSPDLGCASYTSCFAPLP